MENQIQKIAKRYDEIKYQNIEDSEISELVEQKIKRWKSEAGAQACLIDDMPEEIFDNTIKHFESEAKAEVLKNLSNQYDNLLSTDAYCMECDRRPNIECEYH